MHELWSETTHDLSETSDDSSETSHSWFWSDRQTEDDDDNTTCALHKKSNDSDPFHIGNTYGGIPTNLITNTIGWILLLLLFIFIRKSAFEYIKKGSLVTVREHNWNKLIHVFYTVTDNPAEDDVISDFSDGSAARGDI